jgi:hypothetical protein
MNDSIKVIAAWFLVREKAAQERKDYSAAVAYANAYDMLCYAVDDRDDCISQFDGYEDALALLNKDEFGHISELEGIYKGW